MDTYISPTLQTNPYHLEVQSQPLIWMVSRWLWPGKHQLMMEGSQLETTLWRRERREPIAGRKWAASCPSQRVQYATWSQEPSMSSGSWQRMDKESVNLWRQTKPFYPNCLSVNFLFCFGFEPAFSTLRKVLFYQISSLHWGVFINICHIYIFICNFIAWKIMESWCICIVGVDPW